MDKTLLPYDAIVKATKGKPEAVAAVLENTKDLSAIPHTQTVQ